MEILPNQNDKPATVFIFGAGASYADGVPLQADILPQIIEGQDTRLKRSETAKRFRHLPWPVGGVLDAAGVATSGAAGRTAAGAGCGVGVAVAAT